MPMYWENATETQIKGGQEGVEHLHARPNQRRGPAGEVYARSEWTLKTNEGSIAKQMHLSGEFSGYSEWGKGVNCEANAFVGGNSRVIVSGERGPEGVQNAIRPPRKFSNRLIYRKYEREREEITDKEPSGHLEHRLGIKVAENEEAVKHSVDSEPINAEWAFAILMPCVMDGRGNSYPGLQNSWVC